MRHAIVAAIAILSVAGVTAEPSPGQQGQGGWTTLFDGTSLNGWNRVGDANWEIVDGTVQATKGGTSFLVTSASYDDFQITLDFWTSDDANSGVFIRCQDPKDITAQGTKLIVVMNGIKTVDVDHKGHVRGPLALQYGAGTVRFRNVRIRAL